MLFMDESFRIRAVCLHCREKPDVFHESKQANDNSVKLQNRLQKKKVNSRALVCVGQFSDPRTPPAMLLFFIVHAGH